MVYVSILLRSALNLLLHLFAEGPTVLVVLLVLPNPLQLVDGEAAEALGNLAYVHLVVALYREGGRLGVLLRILGSYLGALLRFFGSRLAALLGALGSRLSSLLRLLGSLLGLLRVLGDLLGLLRLLGSLLGLLLSVVLSGYLGVLLVVLGSCLGDHLR